MGWTPSLSGQAETRHSVSGRKMDMLGRSRQLRSSERFSSYQSTVFSNKKNQELKEAKADLDKLRKERTDGNLKVGTDEYNDWLQKYNEAKEDYEQEKCDINDYYDDINQELEEEQSDYETEITTRNDTDQARNEYDTQIIQALGEAVSTDIQNSAVKY